MSTNQPRFIDFAFLGTKHCAQLQGSGKFSRLLSAGQLAVDERIWLIGQDNKRVVAASPLARLGQQG